MASWCRGGVAAAAFRGSGTVAQRGRGSAEASSRRSCAAQRLGFRWGCRGKVECGEGQGRVLKGEAGRDLGVRA